MNRKKILVVDDNAIILKTFSFKLKANDFDVLTAVDGAEAITAVRQQTPDLILLDIGFPPEVAGVPWDGLQLIEWIKRQDEGKHIPIIVITGGEASKFKEKSLERGASAFFQKPVNNDELLATIREILKLPPAGAAAPPPTP